MSEHESFDFNKITPERVGNILLDAIRKIDNWDPVTCPIDELKYHIESLECIEDLVHEISLRPIYLRGVLSARVLHESVREYSASAGKK